MAVEKNWKKSLVATVNFGVTVDIEEIEFLNNQKVSEEKKSGLKSKLTMLDLNITIVLANLKVIFSTENPNYTRRRKAGQLAWTTGRLR